LYHQQKQFLWPLGRSDEQRAQKIVKILSMLVQMLREKTSDATPQDKETIIKQFSSDGQCNTAILEQTKPTANHFSET
jgi:hypothetical protein